MKTSRILALTLSYAIALMPSFAFGQAALIPPAETTFLDVNGDPLVGGKVFFYVPNTTTKKTTWFDNLQAVPQANPVVLDAAGRAVIFGQGNYRQILTDQHDNLIWDGFTSAYGSTLPSGANGTDTAPVGTVLPWAGFALPINWVYAYGQTVNRADFPDLLAALTLTSPTALCTNTSDTITGLTDTSQVPVGAPIEASCLSSGTTVLAVLGPTSVQVSVAAHATTTTSAVIFPWGDGNGTLTFTIPDLRGRVAAGADSMGGTAANRLTTTYFGTSAATPASAGGASHKTITKANLPVYNLDLTSATVAATSALTDWARALSTSNGAFSNGGQNAIDTLNKTQAAVASTGTLGGTIPLGGSGTDMSVVQPTLTMAYIIKVKANSTGAGGVVSLNGLFGDVTATQLLDNQCGNSVQGNVLYRDAAAWNCLAPGTIGQILSSGGASANPAWQTVGGTGTVTSVSGSGGSTGLTLSGGPIATSGTLTLGGTLGVANGGTGLTGATAGTVLTGTGATSAAFTASPTLSVASGAIAMNLVSSAGGSAAYAASAATGQQTAFNLTSGTSLVSLTNNESSSVLFNVAAVPLNFGTANVTRLTISGGSSGAWLAIAAGTAGVAPLDLAVGTDLSTATAGSFEYDGTRLAFTPQTSNRAVLTAEHICSLASNYSLTDTTAAQKALNCSTNGAITLPASTAYEFELSYVITSGGSSNAHTWSLLSAGSATLTSGSMTCTARTATTGAMTAVLQGTTSTLGTAFAVTASANGETVTVTCSGRVNINGAGTWIPQVKLSFTTGQAVTMLAGSYYRMWPLGSGSVAAVGNWN